MERELLARLAGLADGPQRERFFASRPELRSREALIEICDAVTGRLWVDLDEADGLIGAAGWLADDLGDDFSRGRFLRARANVELFRRNHAKALDGYRAALARFEASGDEMEAGLTRLSATHSFVYLGRFAEALEWIAAAREIFSAHGDELRLARLDFNTGTLLARQDRFEEALECYESAQRGFARVGQPSDVAVSLRNIAVCLQDLNRLREAGETYRQATDYCDENGLGRMGAEVRCNSAYLHFLRGDYALAIRGFEGARRLSEELDDRQHRALADLDEAEVYLELNMPQEAERLAEAGGAGFEALDMGYEAAKAKVFEALALSRRGGRIRRQAIEQLVAARLAFEAEGNRVWPARIDLHRATVLRELGEPGSARRLAGLALDKLHELPSLAAACRILLARLEVETGDAAAALRRMDELLPELERGAVRKLAFPAHLARAQALEANGDAEAALAAFAAAERALDEMRGQLATDELKIAYLEDKQAVYEALFRLRLYGPEPLRDVAEAFRCMEKGKSRSLVDLMAVGVQRLPAKTARSGPLAAELRRLREEVGWLERRLDRAESGETEASEKRIGELRGELRARERELVAAVRRVEVADHEYGSLQVAVAVEPEAVQAALPEQATLVEYFAAGSRLSAAVVRRDALEFVALGDMVKLEEEQSSLRFQLGKFHRGGGMPDELRGFANQAVQTRLRSLYGRLVEPLEPWLEGHHLFIVPHGSLHWLPFQALDSGDGCLLERFTVSYAPSAGVLLLCAGRSGSAAGPPLVLGVADEKAPLIEREARAVAEALPGSTLLLGDEASEENLRRLGGGARFVHLASHGFFRSDHPMFSALKLGRGRLSVLDLYGLDLNAELVVLSGCSTGLSEVRGGDEQVGLSRGVLYAGARALVSTLWDVHDESTALLMERLYRRLAAGENPAVALAGATQELRQSYPEPYYWAPFVLTGWPLA